MKVTSIHIIKLHDEYNYQINFDEKLTFLYGTNGCGKTTVLNILAAIVTGKLFNLTEYRFEEISLYYSDNKKKNGSILIKTILQEEKYKKMSVSFLGETYEIEDIQSLKERLYRKSEDENIDRMFQKEYPFVERIKEIFNYVYLPLNRYGEENISERDFYNYSMRRRYYIQQESPYNTYLNDSLRYIAGLIKDNCMKINVMENEINDRFRKEVLSSSIQVSTDMRIKQVFSEMNDCDWSEVSRSKDAYIKTLNEIGVYDTSMQRKLEQFFVEFKDAYDDYQKNRNNQRDVMKVELAWQYAEFLKIKSIAELAKENEKNKEGARKTKEVFLDVINDFFANSGTDKKIMINSSGEVFFESHKRKFKLADLSSGEKQIIITFASLIFGLNGKNSGIYIVDEPEASLHLEWQAKFVPSILKANKNVQLIFATHSPELIGNYRDKAVKLERK